MRFPSIIGLACSLPLVVKAAPVLQSRALAASDALVLSEIFGSIIAGIKTHVPSEFAEVLNELEKKFYSDALAKFHDPDFTSAGFSVTDVPELVFKYDDPSLPAFDWSHTNTGKFNLTNNHTSTCTSSWTVTPAIA